MFLWLDVRGRLYTVACSRPVETCHGWEDLSFAVIKPKYEDEMRRNGGSDGDLDSSSNTSELAYPSGCTLMSSPLKVPLFSDAIGSRNNSNGSTVHRKRIYVASFDDFNRKPSAITMAAVVPATSSPTVNGNTLRQPRTGMFPAQ